jgi:hypothetical protein
MDFDDDGCIQRIGGRLRNALVADLVMACEDREEGNRHLRWSSNDQHEWTRHLARQLGMRANYVRADDHDTLMVVVAELERILRTPALLRSHSEPDTIAQTATKHINADQAERMLVAGPTSWRQAAAEAPPGRIREVAERSLASALTGLFGRWSGWDVVGLGERWRELEADEKAEAARVAAELRQRVVPKPKRVGDKLIPPPPAIYPSAEELGRLKDGRGILGHYDVPGDH